MLSQKEHDVTTISDFYRKTIRGGLNLYCRTSESRIRQAGAATSLSTGVAHGGFNDVVEERPAL